MRQTRPFPDHYHGSFRGVACNTSVTANARSELAKSKVHCDRALEIRETSAASEELLGKSLIHIRCRALAYPRGARCSIPGEKKWEASGEIASIKGNPETYSGKCKSVNHGNLIRIAGHFPAADRRESSLDTHSREPFRLIETAGS